VIDVLVENKEFKIKKDNSVINDLLKIIEDNKI